METLQKIYVAYLGVLAVFVCFIAWLAAKLRAERINRIRIEKEKQAAETKINNLEYDFKSAKDSLASYVSLHENSQKIIELSKAEITKLEERINRQSDIIKELEQDKENLINCISRTGIRDVKGVVRKCNLGEIQSVISGNHPILNKVEKKRKVKLIQPKPTRDWNVPQAFPIDYIVPNRTEVKCIKQNNYVEVGSKGFAIETSNMPYVKWDDSTVYHINEDTWSLLNDELAPINPLDHPEHPQFNKK